MPEWIVITPWLLGSGKFVIPCLRMQAENFAPSAAFPTRIADLEVAAAGAARNGFTAPSDGPLCAVVVAGVVLPATLAIPGEPPPPPQPAANAARATRGARMIGRCLRMAKK